MSLSPFLPCKSFALAGDHPRRTRSFRPRIPALRPKIRSNFPTDSAIFPRSSKDFLILLIAAIAFS